MRLILKPVKTHLRIALVTALLALLELAGRILLTQTGFRSFFYAQRNNVCMEVSVTIFSGLFRIEM